MPGPTLTIPEDTMRELIGHAILAGIDVQARDALIQSAINFLVAPSKHTIYGRTETGPSPLEEAFKVAVRQYAHRYAQEWIESNEEVQQAMRAQLDDLFAAYRSKLAESDEFRTELNAWVIDHLTTRRSDH